eukprot:scaffold753_cov199-Alexandrium_tamarense.AAC.14
MMRLHSASTKEEGNICQEVATASAANQVTSMYHEMNSLSASSPLNFSFSISFCQEIAPQPEPRRAPAVLESFAWNRFYPVD